MNESWFRIQFDELSWENHKEGLSQKTFIVGNKRLRLLKIRDSFIEDEWCLNGHLGYVVEGEMKIDFNGKLSEYKKGDGLWIEEGEDSKHKVIVGKGLEVQLILFESIK